MAKRINMPNAAMVRSIVGPHGGLTPQEREIKAYRAALRKCDPILEAFQSDTEKQLCDKDAVRRALASHCVQQISGLRQAIRQVLKTRGRRT